MSEAAPYPSPADPTPAPPPIRVPAHDPGHALVRQDRGAILTRARRVVGATRGLYPVRILVPRAGIRVSKNTAAAVVGPGEGHHVIPTRPQRINVLYNLRFPTGDEGR